MNFGNVTENGVNSNVIFIFRQKTRLLLHEIMQ